MKVQTAEEIIYSINVKDLQDVSAEVLNRPLTRAEINLMRDSVGDHIDWFQAIENSIRKHIQESSSAQLFWELIPGDDNLYTEIVEPLGHKAKEKNDEFQVEYAKLINKFTFAFGKVYCLENGAIDWKKLVRFNSGKQKQ